MTTPAPDGHEAQHALNMARQQQVNLVSSSLPRRTPRQWLAFAGLFVLIGLALDLFSSSLWALTLFGVVAVAAVLAFGQAERRRSGLPVRSAWLGQQVDNRTYWIFIVWILVVVWVLQFAGGAFGRMGLAWPNTLGGCVAAAVFLLTGPLASSVIRRRVIANVESGRGGRLHGVARALSLLPVAEARERHQQHGSEQGRS